MLLVRRRGVPAATTVTVQKEKATPPALVVRRPPMAGSATDNFLRLGRAKEMIEEHLKLISNAHTAIDEAQAVIDKSHKVIEAQLRSFNLKEHSDGMYKAILEEIWSRQSRTVDPKKFRARVTAEVFWDSVKVNLDKAKEHLSEKEINAMSDVVPSKMTGIQLRVDRVKKKK